MVKNTHTLHGLLSHDRGRLLAYTVLGAGALSLSLFALPQGIIRQPSPAPVAAAAAPSPAQNPYGAMVVGLGPWARTAAAAAPALRPSLQTAAAAQQPGAKEMTAAQPAPALSAEAEPSYPQVDAPLPPRRPAELKNLAARAVDAAPIRQAALPAQPAAPTPGDNRGFLEKIFGGAGADQQQQASQPQTTVVGRNGRRSAPVQQAMAYAPQEPASGGLFGGLTSAVTPVAPAQPAPAGATARAGAGTAVYDISAHTVYMPDGSRLEAHSGLREHLDDPRYVHVRMRGPTPPSVYTLSPREALFHGVEALRLTPSSEVYGRAGLLAHTYMLGPNGDSNGCVSFRDYQSFLNAYKRGEVRRLVVVARM